MSTHWTLKVYLNPQAERTLLFPNAPCASNVLRTARNKMLQKLSTWERPFKGDLPETFFKQRDIHPVILNMFPGLHTGELTEKEKNEFICNE